jgi:hypothetical protein
MKVIETNLSFTNNIIGDHQSRIIEIENWEEYKKEYKGKIPVCRNDIFSKSYIGSCIPKFCLNIKILNEDDFHIQCEITHLDKSKSISMAYLIQE